MSFVGSMEQFDPSEEDWPRYVSRFEQFLLVNDVTAAKKKVALLVTTMGPKTYRLLEGLVLPRKPTELTLDGMVKALGDHFVPKRSVIAETYHFHQRHQQEGETVADYVADLRRLSSKCDFGDYLERAMRDMLVQGVQSESIRRRLLIETDLSLEMAVKIAESSEGAERQAKEMVRQQMPTEANYVRTQPKEGRRWPQKTSMGQEDGKGKTCNHCGSRSRRHAQDECYARTLSCYKCGCRGHVRRACRKESSTSEDSDGGYSRNGRKTTSRREKEQDKVKGVYRWDEEDNDIL